MLKLEISYGDPAKKLYTFKIPSPVLDKLYKIRETEPGIGILVTDSKNAEGRPLRTPRNVLGAFLLWRKEEEEEEEVYEEEY
ncbi:hypothetical protein ES703_90106 [subsurface metagenome]